MALFESMVLGVIPTHLNIVRFKVRTMSSTFQFESHPKVSVPEGVRACDGRLHYNNILINLHDQRRFAWRHRFCVGCRVCKSITLDLLAGMDCL